MSYGTPLEKGSHLTILVIKKEMKDFWPMSYFNKALGQMGVDVVFPGWIGDLKCVSKEPVATFQAISQWTAFCVSVSKHR